MQVDTPAHIYLSFYIISFSEGLTTPATSLHFLPLHLAVIGPHPFTEAVDLLCPKEESIPMNEEEEEDTCYSFYSKKDVVNFCNPNSLVVRSTIIKAPYLHLEHYYDIMIIMIIMINYDYYDYYDYYDGCLLLFTGFPVRCASGYGIRLGPVHPE